ncbi:MAG: AI-2E family transporter, partial [Dehalococcoidia bacterium]|nr:AI-2E family transporter [Dehalococcoidia bacterium]
DAAAALQATGGELLGRGLRIATGVTDALVGTCLVLVSSLYLVVDGHRIRHNLASIIPPSRQGLFVFLEASVLHILGGYIRGQLTIAAIVGTGVGLGCWLLGVQFPLVLGVLAFCFELVPMVGPLLSSIPALVVSLFQPFPLVLFVLAFFLVVMLVEGQVLSPRITGQAVGLHPIATILALIGGAEVAGMWGALFAVPLVGLGAVLGRAALNELNGRPASQGTQGDPSV